jgi:hypothetical protein
VLKAVPLADLYRLCDRPQCEADPVVHVVADNQYGYALLLDLAEERVIITNTSGQQLWFRTIEQLIGILADAPLVSRTVKLHFAAWKPSALIEFDKEPQHVTEDHATRASGRGLWASRSN